MRLVARLFTVLTTVLTLLASTLSLAAPAQAAGTSAVAGYRTHAAWEVRRWLDSSGEANAPEGESVWLAYRGAVQPARLAALAVDDVVEVRMEVAGAYIQQSDAAFEVKTGGSWLPRTDATEMLVRVDADGPSELVFTANFQLVTSAATVKVTPALYINGVKSTNAIADDFDLIFGSPNGHSGSSPYLTFTKYLAEYTVESSDWQITTDVTVCADVTAVSAGQTLAITATSQRNGADVTMVNSTKRMYADLKPISTTVPNPKPTKTLVGTVEHIFSSITAGDVLGWKDGNITAGGTSVTTDCLTSVGTTTASGFAVIISGLDALGPLGTDFSVSAAISCEMTERASGKRVDFRQTMSTPSATNYCQAPGLKVGEAYDVKLRVLGGGYSGVGAAIFASWDYSFTATAPNFGAAPVLTGSGPGSAKYESVDNPTSRTILTGANGASGNDGEAGKYVLTWVDDDTMRLNHWGQVGELPFGSSQYVEFANPVSRFLPSSMFASSTTRQQVAWFGERDKWAVLWDLGGDFQLITGTDGSSAATSKRLAQSALDAACVSAAGTGATAGRQSRSRQVKLLGSATSTPSLIVTCSIAADTSAGAATSRKYLMSIDNTGANLAVDALVRVDSVGEVNPAQPTYEPNFGSTEPNLFTCSDIKFAANPKRDLAPTDPALVIVATVADKSTGNRCYSLQVDDSAKISRVETTILYADGTTTRQTEAIELTGKLADNIKSHSVAFDSVGNVNWLVGTQPNRSGNDRSFTLAKLITEGEGTGQFIDARTLSVDSKTEYLTGGLESSNLVLANGAGNADAVYAARIKWSITLAAATINLSTNSVTTGEIVTQSWTYTALNSMITDGADAETSGAVNLYLTRSVSTYSVIHWLPGVDPNLPPTVITPSSALVAAGTTAVLTAQSTSANAAWSITGGANQSLFKINATTGALEFKAAAVADTYEVEITVTDTVTGKSSTQLITVYVTGDSGPDTTDPVISVDDPTPTVTVGATAVLTLEADESVTWSITGGANQALFEVDPDTGELKFKNPASAGTYTVIVTATDAAGNTSEVTITVTVVADTTDPVIEEVDTTPTVNPGDTAVLDFDADEDVTWSISGVDASRFEIDPVTGELVFKDPAEPGTYTVVVTATDGAGNSTSVTITVTVPTEPVGPEINVPTELDVNEFSSGKLITLKSNQSVTWEIIDSNGIGVYLDGADLLLLDLVLAASNGATITIRATNPSTGLTTDITITVGVTPLELSLAGSVDADGNATYTLSSNFDTDVLDSVSVTCDNPAVTNIQYVNGQLTFEIDPSYTGPITFTFCIEGGEGCLAEKSVTIEVGAVSEPTEAIVKVVGPNKTKITWAAAANAVRYVVRVNGKVVCSTTATACLYKGLLGPKSRVTITAIGSNGTTATIRASHSAAAFALLARISNFTADGYQLGAKQRKKLRALARELKAVGLKSLRLVGYTDNLGARQSDRSLSLARARAVKFFLRELLPGVKITVVGAGRKYPVKPNTSPANRAQNRRVEILGR